MSNNNTSLPADVVEEINLSAKAFAAGMWTGISKHDAKQREYVERIFEAGATEYAIELREAEKQIKDLKEALQNLVDQLPKGESLWHYFAKEPLIYARGILAIYKKD